MKIAVETHLLNHSKRSGVMTYTEGLVKGLYEVDKTNEYDLIFYSLRRPASEMPGPSGGNFQKKVIKIPDQTFRGREWIVDKIGLPLFFKKNKIRVFHRLVGYSVPKVAGVAQVLTIHDLRTLTIGDQYSAQDIGQYKKTVQDIDICTVVSECTRRDVVEHLGIDEKKVRVTYLAADERYKPASEEKIRDMRQRLNLTSPYFLSVGSVPRKNIEGIIRAFAKTNAKKEFQLVLVCRDDLTKYQALAESLGIKDRLVFMASLTDDDLVTLYSAARCFVFASLYEGFGLPILEAMNCGTPVITSTVSSCPEVAADAALLVDPKNQDEIASAIDRMAGDERLRQEFVQKGFERAGLFSWRRFAEQLKTIYESV